jgi:DNA-binding NarL/FixJ family response regulator
MRRITPREVQVLNLLAKGKNNAEIAEDLEISKRTVKAKLYNIAMKLRIESAHPRVLLAQYWSWPIFRIGCGYESPTSSRPAQ